MGDIGSAFSSGLSGLSSGVSNAFGGLTSGLSSALSGGGDMGMGGMDASGLNTDSMFSNLGSDAFDDPTGSAGASQAMTPPADIAAAGPNTDPASTIGGAQSGASPGTNQNQGQGQNQNQQNQNPFAQVWKNLQGMGKAMAGGAQKANPFQTGASGGAQAQPGPTAPTPQPTPPQPQPSPGGTSVTAGDAAPSDAGMDPEIAARQAGAAPGQAGGPGAAATQPGGQAPIPGQPKAAPGAAAAPAPAAAGGGGDAAAPAPSGGGTPAAPSGGGGSIPPSTGTGAGGAPDGQQTPTNPMSVIGPLLRDILGLAMGGPSALPQLASDLMGGMGGQGGGLGQMMGMMGGMGGGGMPPWAMRSMMPFMRGRRGGFMGFNGGMLRPGYYPNRMQGNRFGFHPGGFHPGWNPGMAGGGGSSGGGGASGRWTGGGSVMGRGRMDPTVVRGLASQLESTGVPREAVPGVIAGLMGESGQGLDPRSFNARDPGGSGGEGQWNRGRLTGPSGMLAFARNHGVDVDPMNARDAMKVPRDVQQAYLMSELQGPRFAGLMQNLRNTRDPYAALQNWVDIYENPQDKWGAINQRRQYINAIASILAGGGDGGAPATATAANPPAAPAQPNVQDAIGGDAQG
jgi:hypothetical protein